MELADILNNNPGIVPFSAVTGAAQDLIPTGVQTSAYSAVAGNAVPVDASSASVTITLPTAPADRSRVAVKMIAVSGSFATTINTGSGDVLNKAGGSTSATLSLLNQGLIFQYAASTKIWIVYAGDVPLSQLDARYATIASPSFTGTVKFPDGVVTQASTGQLLFGTSSSALYLFSGTNGLIVNNQANTMPLLTLTNAGALTLSGNASFNGVNITAATNPALNYGGSLFLTRTAAGTVSVGSTQGGTDGTVITSTVTSAGALALAAGGTNQNINLTPSGTGYVHILGSPAGIVIGNSGIIYNPNPGNLAIQGDFMVQGAGANGQGRLTVYNGGGSISLSQPTVGTFAIDNGTAGNYRDLLLRSLTGSGPCIFSATITPSGTTGAQTINKPSGSVRIAAAGTSVVVTNSLCTSTSFVYAMCRTNDGTAYVKSCVPAAGSFTINLGAAATAETEIAWFVNGTQ